MLMFYLEHLVHCNFLLTFHSLALMAQNWRLLFLRLNIGKLSMPILFSILLEIAAPPPIHSLMSILNYFTNHQKKNPFETLIKIYQRKQLDLFLAKFRIWWFELGTGVSYCTSPIGNNISYFHITANFQIIFIVSVAFSCEINPSNLHSHRVHRKPCFSWTRTLLFYFGILLPSICFFKFILLLEQRSYGRYYIKCNKPVAARCCDSD